MVAGLKPCIKWPNDVWIDGRKCCGILIKSQQAADRSFVASVGVGINVNQDMSPSSIEPELAAQATSLRTALGSPIDRETLLAVFCNRLELLLSFEQPAIMAEYRRYDMLLGKQVTIKPKLIEDAEGYEAEVLGYDADGSLLVRRIDNNTTASLVYGEVMVRPTTPSL